MTEGVIKFLLRMLYDLTLITDDAQVAKSGIDQVRTHLSFTIDGETVNVALKHSTTSYRKNPHEKM